MVLAVEPMVNAGRHMVRMGDDGWAIYSQDGSLAAHFEFTIAVTADGPRILTPWHEERSADRSERLRAIPAYQRGRTTFGPGPFAILQTFVRRWRRLPRARSIRDW